MYKTVSKSSIDSISIKITDNLGNPVTCMDNTNVLAVLHFRSEK